MLLYNLNAIAKKLEIDYTQLTSQIEHRGIKGNYREELLKRYLRELIPSKYSIGTGVIVDANQSQSRQQDFFIYDNGNSPVFLKMEAAQVIPVESVYAVIEVKSVLTKAELEKSIINIRSVKRLELNPLETKFYIPSKENQTLGLVFAYSCNTTVDTIISNLYQLNKHMDIPYNHQINMICILDKGVIVYIDKRGMNQITLMPSENTIYTKIESQENVEKNLTLFYLLLQHHLNLFIKVSPDLLLYAQRGGFFDQCFTSTSLDMMDKHTVWNIGKSEFTVEEIKEMSKASKQLMGNLEMEENEKEEIFQNVVKVFEKIKDEDK